jgi:nanoRNase/pAp phosphatase (c-di-AMP/oligoRNAs hydrolase)
MDSSQQAATIVALEAATDALMIAMRRRPDPDLEAAGVALRRARPQSAFSPGRTPRPGRRT